MATIDLSYPKMLSLFPQHLDPKRSESAAFLIWYFENYLRLEEIEAIDAVCDQRGDKGIDGIYVNEDANTIEIYQSKISQKKESSVGDTALKEFEGTLKQFENRKSVEELAKSAPNTDLAKLLQRLDLAKKIDDYDLRGIFVSNLDLDANGKAYLKHSSIRVVGKSELESTFISSARNAHISKPAKFDVSNHDIARYIVDKDHVAIIAPIKATELVQLDGITNQALFAFNVRGPLGRTQVNKDIAASIKAPQLHKFFPLFHNGITIIAQKVDFNKDSIMIDDYYVVNGCQSLSEFKSNSQSLTDNLRVLVKIIKMEPASDLSKKVTSFSNNQNGVKARDFKSNNPIQIRLQNEFQTAYATEWFYEIKRGEDSRGLPTITNELAGLYMMAFDLKKPWATHRKYHIFEDEHADIFGRPNVNAHRIVLCHLLAVKVDEAILDITNGLFAKYTLTKFVLLYILRLIMEADEVGKEMLTSPEKFVQKAAPRKAMLACIEQILKDTVIDLNAEVDQLGEDFDYRGKLRDEAWVKNLAHKVHADYQKLVSRKRIGSLADEYMKLTAPKKIAFKK